MVLEKSAISNIPVFKNEVFVSPPAAACGVRDPAWAGDGYDLVHRRVSRSAGSAVWGHGAPRGTLLKGQEAVLVLFH